MTKSLYVGKAAMKKHLKALLIAILIVPCALAFTACGKYDKGYEAGYQKGLTDATLPSLETPSSISLHSYTDRSGEYWYLTTGLEVRFSKVANAFAYNIKIQEAGNYDAKYFLVEQPAGNTAQVSHRISGYDLRVGDFSVTVTALSDGIDYKASLESSEVTGKKLGHTSFTMGSWYYSSEEIDNAKVKFDWSDTYDFPNADFLVFDVIVLKEDLTPISSSSYQLSVVDNEKIVDLHSTEFNIQKYTGRVWVIVSLYSVGTPNEGFVNSSPLLFIGVRLDLISVGDE